MIHKLEMLYFCKLRKPFDISMEESDVFKIKDSDDDDDDDTLEIETADNDCEHVAK